ncbi:MAG: Nramp family divalent metal transporter [Verrucomicrobiota bacterium]|nr:Nramp family divalent metal transporter [Verrucomicrobiota bacterium]|tara:strand:+ start:37 stop:1284 length:1248 start_codon:yes stop_codon:yes gene_type:complete
MSEDNTPQPRRWYQALGPGLITACVVIGPGSILTSSKVGASQGYGMSWVVIASVVFMMTFTMMASRLGVVAKESPGKILTDSAGRWLAVLIGLSVFFIASAFQFGNNLGVHTAFNAYIEFDYIVIIFNAAAIAFLFLFKNLYKALEKLMMGFVGLMLLAFAANLIFAQPNLVEWAKGFVPGGQTKVDITVLGLVGTTFVIAAAYFQIYLVRQKGIEREDLPASLVDSRVGACLMALITLMIMGTAAAVLRGQELAGAGEVAKQLEPLFGSWGKGLFCLGLFSAAYSSFLINSMIGGFVLSDGLGLGSDPDEKWTRYMTTVVLLTGMGVALYVINTGTKPVAAIVMAQAVTVIAGPLMAGVLLWLCNRKDLMGEDRNSPLMNALGGVGFVLLLSMAWYTASAKVWPKISGWLSGDA